MCVMSVNRSFIRSFEFNKVMCVCGLEPEMMRGER